jgi:glycosyltransferase involved in cell wall biosynthesis
VTGGIERYVFDLSKELVKLGTDVHVVTLKPMGRPQYEEIDGVHVHRVLSGREEFFILGLKAIAKKAEKVCRENRIDIVHGQIPYLSDVLLRKSKVGIPFIETVHVPIEVEVATLRGTNFRELLFWEKFIMLSTPIAKFIERHIVKRADGLIAVSKSSKRGVMRCYGISEDKVEVIYEGVDVNIFGEARGEKVRERLGLVDEFVILYVGRQCRRKNLEVLIHAFSILKKAYEKIELVMVGRESRYTDRLRALARTLNVEKSVIFTGYVPNKELPSYYAACDVFVLTSHQEAFGLTAVEAMAAGKPVVVPNVGGLPEVVRHGRTGYLYDSFRELVERLSVFVSDKKLARRMGFSARRRVLEKFTVERMARDTFKFYEKILSLH